MKEKENEFSLMRTINGELKEKGVIVCALLSVFLFCLTAHGFFFFNLNLTHDSLNEFFAADSLEWKIRLGRFIAPIFKLIIGENVVMPWLSGIISIACIFVVVLLICKIFSFKRAWQVVSISAFFSVNVTVTALFATYAHDVITYMLAFAVSVTIVYLLIKPKRKLLAIVVSGLNIFVLGIYQAFFAVTLSLLIIYSVKQLLLGEQLKCVLLQLLYAGVILIVSCFIYLLLAFVIVKVLGLSFASDYNGLGALLTSPLEFLRRIVVAFAKTLIALFVPFTTYSPTLSTVIIYGVPIGNYLICGLNIIMFACSLLFIAKGMFCKKIGKWHAWTILIFIGLLPIVMSLMQVLAGVQHDLMRMACQCFYVIVLVVFDWYKTVDFSKQTCVTKETYQLESKKGKVRDKNILYSAFVFLASMIIAFNGIVLANTCYVEKDLQEKTMFAKMTKVISDIESEEGYVYGESKIAFLGIMKLKNQSFSDLELYVTGTDGGFFYYERYLKNVLQYSVNLATSKEIKELREKREVKDMPVYPYDGSVQTIDGIIVVKFSE